MENFIFCSTLEIERIRMEHRSQLYWTDPSSRAINELGFHILTIVQNRNVESAVLVLFHRPRQSVRPINGDGSTDQVDFTTFVKGQRNQPRVSQTKPAAATPSTAVPKPKKELSL